MGAFDTAFKPKALTPNNTNEATLFTVGTDSAPGQDAQVNINASVLGAATVSARIGIIPSGGSVFWLLFDDGVEAANPLIGMGPLYLQPGDQVRVRTASANNMTFSVTGTNSS